MKVAEAAGAAGIEGVVRQKIAIEPLPVDATRETPSE